MSIVEDYIRIALNKANGNKGLARKSLLEAARRDADLAQQMAAPHLESIVAHAVDRYLRLSGTEDAPPVPVETPVETTPEKPKDASGEAQKAKTDIPPTEASDKHKAAVMQMIAAFKKRDN